MRNEKGQFVHVSTYAVDLWYEINLPYDSKRRRIILVDVINPCAESINKAIDNCISDMHKKDGIRVVRWRIESITKL